MKSKTFELFSSAIRRYIAGRVYMLASRRTLGRYHTVVTKIEKKRNDYLNLHGKHMVGLNHQTVYWLYQLVGQVFEIYPAIA